jgi:hypothetical protein
MNIAEKILLGLALWAVLSLPAGILIGLFLEAGRGESWRRAEREFENA